MATFPGAIPTYAGFTSSHTLAADNHASQHNSEQGDISALATKIGTGASTPTSGMLLRGNGAGTSTWAQANLTSDVTGVLPQANGGTGTTLATGTGKAVYDTSPALTTPSFTNATGSLNQPTISDFTNANHTHQNTAGGGQLTGSAFSTGSQIADREKNPYKFFVYLSAAIAQPGSNVRINFDTALFDTGSNVDLVTNKGRFTAPIAGFYMFSANLIWTGGFANNGYDCALYKNGTIISPGNRIVNTYAGPPSLALTAHALLQLAANDYVEVGSAYAGGGTLSNGTTGSTFQGFLVSAT